MTVDQLDLFTEREHRSLGAPPVPNACGVFDADETLELRGPHRYIAQARIELVHVPAFGWIYATSYHLTNGGAGYRPALKWAKRGDSRDQALTLAKVELADNMESFLQRHDSGGDVRQAREVVAWLATLA